MRNEPDYNYDKRNYLSSHEVTVNSKVCLHNLPCALTLAGLPSPISVIDSSEIFSEENDFAVCFFFIPVVENNEQD